MILVTGSIVAQQERFEEALVLSLEHVRRSRLEAGCIAHAVHRDAEDPNRLVFVEEWADRAALAAHFALPASRSFVKAVVALAVAPPQIRVYEATLVEMG
jgi:quinol monooxygenase YgiN